MNIAQIKRNPFHYSVLAVLVLCLWPCNSLFAEAFSVTYTFNSKAKVSIESASNALEAKIHRPGGPGLKSQTFSPEGWTSELIPAQGKVFCDAAIRIDLMPRSGNTIDISEIEIYQQSIGTVPVKVRTCCTLNGMKPDLQNNKQSSPEVALTAHSRTTRFTPSIGIIDSDGKTFASVFACAKAPEGGGQWVVSKIIIQGTSQPVDLPENTVVIPSKHGQKMRFGIDAERLWWWYPGIDNELARYAVGDLKVSYVRVAINCAYEREEGKKNPKAYDRILNMMKALKKENPAIRFFASPRPLEEAYSPEERDKDFGGRVPWSPFPLWVLPFEKSGTDENGKSTWQIGDLNEKKYTRYLADYLNFMHKQGLDIAYLDTSNECGLPPSKVEYMVNHLKGLLNAGVKMPLIVAPSAWNMAQGVEWVQSADKDMLDVIACHNTDPGGSMEAFAELGHKLGKEVWNSELHDWVGIEPRDEILTSEILWKHIRAGFNGIDSWLFFGPLGGKDHTMIWTDGRDIRTSYKYEIYKQLVNKANQGFYLDTKMPRKDIYTAAFVKDKTLTVWALNTSTKPMKDLGFSFQGMPLNGQKIEVTRWGVNTANEGKASRVTSGKTFFTHTIDGESLYCFTIVSP